MKNIKTLALSGIAAHLLFCFVFSIGSNLLDDNQGGSYKGANLFFVLVFLFWYDLAALVLWHIIASAIDYQGGLRFKHAFGAGVLIPPLLFLAFAFPQLWQALSSHWTHQATPPLLAENESNFWFFLVIAPLLGLTITMPHFFIYRQVFPQTDLA